MPLTWGRPGKRRRDQSLYQRTDQVLDHLAAAVRRLNAVVEPVLNEPPPKPKDGTR